MGCQLKYNEAIRNGREALIKSEAIMSGEIKESRLEIGNINKFDEFVSDFQKRALINYDVPGVFYTKQKQGLGSDSWYKAVAIKEDFDKIDAKRKEFGIYESKEAIGDYNVRTNRNGGLNNDTRFQLNTEQNLEHKIASEKTIRDLAARMSDRIGMPIKFESDRSKNYKGKIENDIAYINLAYATLDTPIHEILGHPIIRAIKNGLDITKIKYLQEEDADSIIEPGQSFLKNGLVYRYESDAPDGERLFRYDENENIGKNKNLYNNLLEELSTTERGKEVLDRIKKDYANKEIPIKSKHLRIIDRGINSNDEKIYWIESISSKFDYHGVLIRDDIKSLDEAVNFVKNLDKEAEDNKYSLEEQQEEALVELLGMMTADKLDNVKDGGLISLLKRLLKEIASNIRSLFTAKEIDVSKLPDNITLGNLSDLLAYSNSKLILPGYEVEYTTPDNVKHKTYQEASNHINELAKNIKDVDLDSISISINDIQIDKNNLPSDFKHTHTSSRASIAFMKDSRYNDEYNKEQEVLQKKYEGKFIVTKKSDYGVYPITNENQTFYNTKEDAEDAALNKSINSYKKEKSINSFIEKNKEYEQSKEIIEEWKKINNIEYNPEEIYTRGQGFYSVVGAYSQFDVNLMFQNLLYHIEDNKKAGGEFTISAFTRHIDKKLNHLEGGGGKVRFKIFPKPNHIKWAANTDVYSGSVWDASEKINKDKKSELLGVSYTKSPSLSSLDSVQPNLAAITDEINHYHNELGIELTGGNFRFEWDDDIPNSTINLLNKLNKILDEKFGKIIEPKIEKLLSKTMYDIYDMWNFSYEGNPKFFKTFEAEEDANQFMKDNQKQDIYNSEKYSMRKVKKTVGIKPTQTKETLKESINNIKNKVTKGQQFDLSDLDDIREDFEDGKISQEQYDILTGKNNKKEYTSQALINTKIAALKEASRKHSRGLIRSEVSRVKEYYPGEFSGFLEDDLPFQRIPSQQNDLNNNDIEELSYIDEENIDNQSFNEDNDVSLEDNVISEKLQAMMDSGEIKTICN